ncbi:hypothetical protein DTL42_17095 [Bremerella cremea]|uniref:Thioredoxin domain-containing protein n=1 Tax=Bremerella cremea TaxID=1031537 RepID=A0A368KN26_9BACT|nr:redoxin domain-containing protein [Bremerella cremea]RCS44638.1 hypothetical protein DTL42_17095 [Bremerella cremea]
MRWGLLLIVLGLCGTTTGTVEAAETEPWNDPFWSLLHEPAAIAELQLNADQQQAFHALRDDLDLRFFPLRNQTKEVATAGTLKIIAEAREKLSDLLEPQQFQRYQELVLQRLGNDAFLHPLVVDRLKYNAAQQAKLEKISAETNEAAAALRQAVADQTKDRTAAQQEYTKLLERQQKKLLGVLTPIQQSALRKVVGQPFTGLKTSQPHFRAPDFSTAGEWLNSSPLSLKELRGKVVVVHFYAFGCINCIRNYPWYLEWSEKFKDQEVVIVGIHTPETNAEQNSASVRRKATEAKFRFPILIDAKKENWNAWGNSMWPCVYVIDKQGYLREQWAGELKWQGNDGEKYMRSKIEALLTE